MLQGAVMIYHYADVPEGKYYIYVHAIEEQHPGKCSSDIIVCATALRLEFVLRATHEGIREPWA